MPDIDDVLERLVTDEAFKYWLAEDPRAALAPYELTPEDLSLLANQVASDSGGQSAVEQRTSKSAFFALFSQVGEVVGGGEAMHGAGGGGDNAVAEVHSTRGSDVMQAPPEPDMPGGDGSEEGIIVLDTPADGMQPPPEGDMPIDMTAPPEGDMPTGLGGPDTLPEGHIPEVVEPGGGSAEAFPTETVLPTEQMADGSVMPADEQGIIIDWKEPGLAEDHHPVGGAVVDPAADGEFTGPESSLGGPDTGPADQFGDPDVMPSDGDGPQPHLAEGPEPHLADPAGD